MTASPTVAAAFERWKLAELASHYAAPCPDEVMNQLVDIQSDAFETLQSLPAVNASDMLLKLFPLIIRECEPKSGQPPLRPGEASMYKYDTAFLDRLVKQLGSVSHALAEAMAEPHPRAMKVAA